MQNLFEDVGHAYVNQNGWDLAKTLSPVAPADDPDRLRLFWQSTNHYAVKGDIKHFLLESVTGRVSMDRETSKVVMGAWTDVYVAYWKAIGEKFAAEDDPAANGRTSTWTKVYEAWKELMLVIHRGFSNINQNLAFPAWSIQILDTVGKYLRLFAIKSDEERRQADPMDAAEGVELADDFDPEVHNQQQLRDCEQQLKRVFMLCLNDRADLIESRKWGVYTVINLLFKTYFKLNSASMARTILKALGSHRGDIPPLDRFPAAQRVTFKYYEGVLFFLEENYVEAEKCLTDAYDLCHKNAVGNKERILTYLIPCRLLTQHKLPAVELLDQYPRLRTLFEPLVKAIKRGDLRAFDVALAQGEDEFVKKRVYLTLERGRDIALRNLLRKVFLAKGFVEPKNPDDPPVRQTRVRVAEFAAAIAFASRENIDNDEVECLLANMIYKNLMKGYISREHSMVVLSKNGAFPGTGI